MSCAVTFPIARLTASNRLNRFGFALKIGDVRQSATSASSRAPGAKRISSG